MGQKTFKRHFKDVGYNIGCFIFMVTFNVKHGELDVLN